MSLDLRVSPKRTLELMMHCAIYFAMLINSVRVAILRYLCLCEIEGSLVDMIKNLQSHLPLDNNTDPQGCTERRQQIQDR